MPIYVILYEICSAWAAIRILSGRLQETSTPRFRAIDIHFNSEVVSVICEVRPKEIGEIIYDMCTCTSIDDSMRQKR